MEAGKDQENGQHQERPRGSGAVAFLRDRLRGGLLDLGVPSHHGSTRADRRRAATYPAVHPTGWYHLLDSHEIRPGEVKAVEALGEDFAVFRTRSGVLHVHKAHCPHLGASLAEGRVVEDCVECPFHGWRFAGDGALRHVPALDRLPRVRNRSWPVIELHGLVLMYYRANGAAQDVAYEPRYWPELDSPRFSFRGRYASRDIRMHLLEFAENSVDIQHFGRLHGDMRLPWTHLRIPFVEIRHAPRWEVDAERRHVSHFYDDAHLVVLGRDLLRTRATGHVMLVGPASLVVFRISLPDLGDVVIVQTHTPVDGPRDPLGLRVRFQWWAELTVPDILASYVAGNWISQWWQDVSVWEHKLHVARPPLARVDGPVHSLREWFSQFYPGAPAETLSSTEP